MPVVYWREKRIMTIKVSAPGKLLLLGDHAVVYNYPCIVTAVDKRLYVEAEITDKKEDEIISPQVKESRFVLESVAHFKEKFNVDKSVRITTKGDFSHSVGLGSSSAVTVATYKALSELFRTSLTNKQIFDLSYQVNLEVQGVGSGFDIAAATYGGTLYFLTGGKKIEVLPTENLPLVVGYSGIKADTPFYIRKVAEAFRTKKDVMHQLFSQIAKLVESARKEIAKKNYSRLGELMTQNHRLLQELGVSTPKLDEMVNVTIKAGAYGAKLSGAGGGDCMIALVSPSRRKAVEQAIINAEGEVITVDNNAEGARIETTDDQSEMFVVVDHDDNVISYKTRYECHHDKNLIHRAIGVILFNKKGQVLLQKRSRFKDKHPNLYTISASGHVSKGETNMESAERELFEEIGVKTELTFLKQFIAEQLTETEIDFLYTGKHEGPFKINETEVEEVKFVPKNELKNYLPMLTPLAIESFKRLNLI